MMLIPQRSASIRSWESISGASVRRIGRPIERGACETVRPILSSYKDAAEDSPNASGVSGAPVWNSVTGVLAKEYGLQLRRYSEFRFVGTLYGPNFTRENLIQTLEDHRDEDIEIMCHPGWCDLELYRMSSYGAGRVQELDVLCSKEVSDYVKEHGIELCHY